MTIDIAPNELKRALAGGRTQPGFWLTLGNPSIAEIASEAGFAWLLIDMEHGDNTVETVTHQLRAVMRGGAEPMVRVPSIDAAIVKRLMDCGVRSFMFPNVKTAAEAMAAVAATRYPPRGVRGVAGTARGPGYGRIKDYWTRSEAEILVTVQVETLAALEVLEDIASIDGVDCIFVGPSDLSADMGFLGRPGAPEVVAKVSHTLERIKATGRSSGILEFGAERAQDLIRDGYQLIAVAGDANVLARRTSEIAAAFPAS